jgi:hypothetical protein
LADARAQQTAAASPAAGGLVAAAPGGGNRARARLLVVTGGHGTADDLEAVASEAALLPGFVLSRFETRGIRIVACRGAVTDFETSLHGQTPRGWEGTGRTWDDVPGTYLDNRKRVIIATIADGAVRAVPTRASGLHGSVSLVVHESLHGYDYSGNHAALRDNRFVQARHDDFAQLHSYEQQAGQAGLEETFAESGARFVVEADVLHTDWPHLFGYWQGGPLPMHIVTPLAPAAPSGDDQLGSARLRDDQSIELDLRAEGPGGAIGHAVLTIAPHEQTYQALRRHLFGADGTPGAAAPAAAGPRLVPFRPLKSGATP